MEMVWTSLPSNLKLKKKKNHVKTQFTKSDTIINWNPV